MMRSNDPFEKRLGETPLRQPPSHWREQILIAADSARVDPKVAPAWRRWMAFVLNPRPASWAALAAIWILVFIFNSQTPTRPSRTSLTARKASIPRIFQERERMLANVFESDEPRALPPPRKTIPGPQSRVFLECITV
jgi:hypothetical protein